MDWLRWLGWMGWSIGVVKFSKVPFIKCFSTDFGPKVTDLPSVFHLTSTLLHKSCSNQKIIVDLLLKLLKLV